jgi:hypothetical protein
MLALYPDRGTFAAKTYDPVADAWRTEPPATLPRVALIHRMRPALFAVGDHALVLGEGRAALFDGMTATWTPIPAPAIDESTEPVTDDRHLVLARRTPCCTSWYGAAFFDPTTRRWADAGHGTAPPPRQAPAVWVGDALLVLPGRNVPLFPGKGEDESDHPGAVWRPGVGWRPMTTEAAPAATFIEWAHALAGDAAGQLLVRVGHLWARYDPSADTWSPASSTGAPLASDRAFRAGRHLLVAGAPDAAIYDLDRDTWTPAALPGLVGGPVLYRVDATRLILIDPARSAATLFDLSTTVERKPLDTRGLPDRRSYEVITWTGHCLILLGSVTYHPDPNSCSGADRPCDMATSIERHQDGSIWCPKLP